MRGRHAKIKWFWQLLCIGVLGLLAPRAARADSLAEPDLSTPRRAAATFMQAANREDWATAQSVFDVAALGPAQRARTGELAKQLAYLLSHSASYDVDRISDDPKGKPDDGVDLEQIATLSLEDRRVAVSLRKVAGSPPRWLFSAGTLTRVPALYQEHGPSEFEARVPPILKRPLLSLPRWQWLGIIATIALAVLGGRALAYLIMRVLLPLSARTSVLWDDELLKAIRSPLRLLSSVFIFVPVVSALGLTSSAQEICMRAASTVFIAGVAWTLLAGVGVVSNLIERRATQNVDAALSPRLRGVQTQVRVLRRVVSSLLALCAMAVILMQFEAVRSAGVSLLASAGVAGLVIGLAAQRTLGSLLAGIQLSVTQPIRIGDAVIVENEYGIIEEITLTYVVVKVWDERRLVLPMSRFLEQPFQNWTKVAPQLHGTVMLYADFTLPVDLLRKKLDALLEGNKEWDGRTKVVHVTDARERTMEIRVLVSAANAGILFGLRAQVREGLIAWLSELEGGRYLPRTRYEGSDEHSPAAAGAPFSPTRSGLHGSNAVTP